MCWCLVQVKSLKLGWSRCGRIKYIYRKGPYLTQPPQAAPKVSYQQFDWGLALCGQSPSKSAMSSGPVLTVIQRVWLPSTCMTCLHSSVKLWSSCSIWSWQGKWSGFCWRPGMVPSFQKTISEATTADPGSCPAQGQFHDQARQNWRGAYSVSHRRKQCIKTAGCDEFYLTILPENAHI